LANEDRAQTSALALYEALQREPYAFDFFQALRLLECAHCELPRLGTAGTPGEEAVRVGQDCSMGFAPSAISSWASGHGSQTPRLGVAFLGLFGPNGPLPLHLTDYVLERQRRHKDETFLRFADVFHHRLLSLFYRAWASAQPAVSFDRPSEDRFGEYVASVCGLGFPSLRARDAMLDGAKLHFAGRLQAGPKNAEGLVAIIQAYFRVSVSITEFIGEWLEISPRDRCLLGASPATATLGVNAIAGAYVFECQHKFRVHIGPLDLSRFEQLLPAGDTLDALVAVVRNYIGDEYLWDLQLVLCKSEVPLLSLGKSAARLGWSSWLGTRSAATDADDLIINPMAHR
jgi:type VI secretion system protein ImpH